MLILNIVFTSWQIFKLLSGGTTCPAIFHLWQLSPLKAYHCEIIRIFYWAQREKKGRKMQVLNTSRKKHFKFNLLLSGLEPVFHEFNYKG